MKRKIILSLVLALALLPLSARAEAPDIAFELPGGEDAGPMELPGELELPAPEGVEPVPSPRATDAPEDKAERIPWLTSYNYPKDKIDFEREIWSILTGKWGLEDFQAAGLMSSIQAESGFCPYNAQGGGPDERGKYEFDAGDSVGFGLCQWTSSGRKAALLRHAKAHGSADLVWDFDIQMGFMGSELDMAALKSTRTLYEAVEWSVMFYEQPDQRYENSWPGTRYEKSLALYRACTGREYEEPPLRYALKGADGESVGSDGVALPALGAPGSLTLRTGCYWRLEIVDGTGEGWLSVKAPAFNHPERLEDCVCGCVCDGEKPLTLTVEKVPPLGQTWEATLRFEFWRGGHETLEIPVRATCTVGDYLALLGRSAPTAALGAAAALVAARCA